MSTFWDLVVVGAGPAGTAAAIRARQRQPNARVLLLDRADFPRDKVCGDGIAAQAVATLAELGVTREEVVADAPRCHRLELRSPGGVAVDRPMCEPVYVIRRRVFDARLVAAAVARGVVLRRSRVRRVHAGPDSVELDDGLTAAVVIGADGAESTVRRQLGVAMSGPGRTAVAIRAYAPDLPGRSDRQLITMSRRGWPAYAWSFPTGFGRSNVGFGQLVGDRPPTRAELLDGMRSLLPDLGDDLTELRGHRLPLSPGRPRVADGRVLLAGDALALINPLSGEGIYYAIRSGLLAADAAIDVSAGAGAGGSPGNGAGARYRELLRRRLGRHLRHTRLLSAAIGRWPALVDAGVRAGRRRPGPFDDLVDLALGEGLITGRLLRALR